MGDSWWLPLHGRRLDEQLTGRWKTRQKTQSVRTKNTTKADALNNEHYFDVHSAQDWESGKRDRGDVCVFLIATVRSAQVFSSSWEFFTEEWFINLYQAEQSCPPCYDSTSIVSPIRISAWSHPVRSDLSRERQNMVCMFQSSSDQALGYSFPAPEHPQEWNTSLDSIGRRSGAVVPLSVDRADLTTVPQSCVVEANDKEPTTQAPINFNDAKPLGFRVFDGINTMQTNLTRGQGLHQWTLLYHARYVEI